MLFVTTENEISWIIYSLFRDKQTIYLTLFSTKGQGSRRVEIGPVAEIYDFLICCRIIYLMKKNVIFICFALKLCDIEADK